jgi:hypothetical protein
MGDSGGEDANQKLALSEAEWVKTQNCLSITTTRDYERWQISLKLAKKWIHPVRWRLRLSHGVKDNNYGNNTMQFNLPKLPKLRTPTLLYNCKECSTNRPFYAKQSQFI